MKKIPLTQGKFALVDNEDYEGLSQFKWTLRNPKNRKSMYAYRLVGQKSIHMHRVIMDTPKGMFVDHVNRNGLDNRRQNLRNCTQSQNQANAGKYRNNQSGYRGVSLDPRARVNPWVAEVRKNRRKYFIGCFSTPKKAHEAYKEFASQLYGEFHPEKV